MSNTQLPTLHPRQNFLEWYHVAALGQILQTVEASYLQSALKLGYGQKILQVGSLGSETLYIPDEHIRNCALVDLAQHPLPARPGLVRALPDELPVASSSIDVLILPHVLEFEPHRHQVLREVERVLKPEGRLFILGLNPWSVHGLIQYLPKNASFWSINFISSHRLLDWLSLLKFDAELGAAFSVTASRVIRFPDTFLGRCRSHLSFAYAVKAIKRRYKLLPIEPTWVAAPELAAGHMFESLSANASD